MPPDFPDPTQYGIPVPTTKEDALSVFAELLGAGKNLIVHMERCRKAHNKKDAENVLVFTGALLSLHIYFERQVDE